MNKVIVFIRERTAIRRVPTTAMRPLIEGGASFAYVFGSVLVFLLAFEALTGLALAAFYSPSTTDAWGSVAYLEDQVAWGRQLRGLHHHGAGAIVIVSGLHLVQTAFAGAYKRPRELVWWLGVVLLVLVLAWAITGYVLPWDQAGYWANRVEVGIAAGTPGVGGGIKQLALGGNDYGNLTLTRFYMLHIALLPGLVTGVVLGHIVLARRHGITPVHQRTSVPRWPNQVLLDVIAMAIVFVVLLVYVVVQGGAGLAAPADPTQAYDARPLWYFRWLFELRELAGRGEQVAAMLAPAMVAGYLIALPLLDKGRDRSWRTPIRMRCLGGLAGVLAVIAALTMMSFSRDSGDPELAKRRADADRLAARARSLAREYGVPATGGADIWSMAPMWRGRMLFAKMCAGCHEASDAKERIGPIIEPGHGDRAWLRAFLRAPSDPQFWGRTKLAKTDMAMDPVAKLEIQPGPLEDIVEYLISQSGETEVDAAKVGRGKDAFEACSTCHSADEGAVQSPKDKPTEALGPNLFGLHSRAFYLSFISNPKHPIHMGPDKSEMPRFDGDLSVADRDAIAEYLVWLRRATPADLGKLGPL